ncbi:MAG: hypothetical protein ACJ8FY_16250 [Gemmataceae bacterium]
MSGRLLIFRKRYMVSLSILLLFSVPFAVAKPPPLTNNELLVAGEAYLNNRQAFNFLTCRFTVTKATARSAEDGVVGKTINPAQERVLWVCDENKVRYQTIAKPLNMTGGDQGSGKVSSTTVPFGTGDYLADGPTRFRYVPEMKCANVFSPDSAGQGIDLTPFSMGMMGIDEKLNPWQLIHDCVNKARVCVEPKREIVDGNDVISFSVGRSPDELEFRYSLDISHGFLPRRITLYRSDGRSISTTVMLTHVRKCSGDRWFPERTVAVSFPRRETDSVSVREIKTEFLDVDERPPVDLFSVEIPEGTQILNPTDTFSTLITQKARVIRADDLGGLLSECQLMLEERHARESSDRKGTLGLPLFTFINILAISCVVLFLLARRFRGFYRGRIVK